MTERESSRKPCVYYGLPGCSALINGIGSEHNLAPAPAKSEALYEVLGHHRQRYYFRTARAGVVYFDATALHRVGAASTLVPDMEHWRSAYPRVGKPHMVDWEAVGADLLRSAIEAGPYEPGPGEGPRPVGRPRKAETPAG